MNEKKSFLKTVQAQIQSKEAKQYVSLELDRHIEQTIQQLKKSGIQNEDAEKRAIQQMGDPIKLGIKMEQIHRPIIDWSLWLLLVIALFMGILPLIMTNMDYQPSLSRKVFDIIIGLGCLYGFMMFDYRKLRKKYWFFFALSGFLSIFFYQQYIIKNGFAYIGFGPFTANSLLIIPFLMIGWAGVFHKYSKKPWLIMLLFGTTLTVYCPISNLPNILVYILLVLTMCMWTYRREIKKMIRIAFTIICLSFLTVIWTSNQMMKTVFLGLILADSGSSYMSQQIKAYLSEVKLLQQPKMIEGSFVPELHTDMAFVTLSYSFGWLFSIGILFLLLFIALRMCWITWQTRDLFGQLITIGAVAVYSCSFIYNIGMTLGLLPIMGFWLPFISFGKLPLLINSIMIGLVLSVYRRKNIISPVENM